MVTIFFAWNVVHDPQNHLDDGDHYLLHQILSLALGGGNVPMNRF